MEYRVLNDEFVLEMKKLATLFDKSIFQIYCMYFHS